MRVNSKGAWVALLLCLVISIPGFLGLRLALIAYSPSVAGSQEAVVFELQKGQSPREISRRLLSAGVIRDADSFFWIGRLTSKWKKIKAGEYKVSAGMSPVEILSVLTSGISIAHPVTVREGINFFEVAAEIEGKTLAPRAKIVELCRSPQFIGTLGLNDANLTTLEGYLYPETYFFNKSMSAEEMIRQMVKRFQAIWGEREDRRARELGMTRHQVVTLASMVEKETGAPQERPLISSVFHNRLKKKMRLQSDPTTIYGIWERYKGNITRADLLAANPYNTYYVPALPAGPISNPGKEAIEAALFPAQSEYLYFVSHNDGTHAFSRTYEEHNAAVRKFQIDPRAREGKSWRDLKKQGTGAAGKR